MRPPIFILGAIALASSALILLAQPHRSIPSSLPESQEAAVFRAIAPTEFPVSSNSNDQEIVPPIDDFAERITKKPFGIFITPETSPVEKDRFHGYHTGVDIEYEDVSTDVPVRAIAAGQVIVSRFAQGYGGVIVIRHDLKDRTVLALYGHLDPARLTPEGHLVGRGQHIGILGEGETPETDSARTHLHFALLRGESVDLRGYVKTPEELSQWYDPEEFFGQ